MTKKKYSPVKKYGWTLEDIKLEDKKLKSLFDHLSTKVVDEYGARPEQKKRRAKRNAARNALLKSGKVKKGDGKDVHHKDGNPLNNDPSNLSIVSRAYNRNNNNKITKKK